MQRPKSMASLTDEVKQCGRDMDALGLQTAPRTKMTEADSALSVACDPQLGRVLVATRSFAVGDVVLREPPLLTFASVDAVDGGPLGMRTDGGPGGLLQAFKAAPETCKDAILDMFHPPLEGSTQHIKNRRQEAKIHAKQLGMDVTLILKLLLIRDTNAHSFSGQKENYSETLWGSPKLAALFDLGSKAAHSCHPNIEYSSKQFYGLEYRAIRPIVKGDYLLYSYIGDLWTSSQVERQNALLTTKFFFCKCTRCHGKDDTRAVTCTKCKTQPAFPSSDLMSAPTIGSTVVLRGLQGRIKLNGQRGTIKEVHDQGRYGLKLKGELVAVNAENLYSTESWQCACGSSTDRTDVHRMEAEIAQNLERAKTLARQALHQVTPNHLDDIVSRAIQLLSPTHFLVTRALMEANTILASHAAARQRAEGPMAESVALFRHMAAKKGIAAVRTMECMAAGCGLGAAMCTLEHPCVHEATQLVFFTGQDLLQVHPRHRDMGASVDAWPALVRHVSKYRMCLEILYGHEDEDVMELMSLGQRPCDVDARCCGNTGCCRQLGSPLLRCARCKTAAYCSKNCQSKAWKAGHKRECKPA